MSKHQKSAGRPSIPQDQKRQKLGVSMTPEAERQAKEIAKRLGISFSAFVEMAVRAQVEKDEIQGADAIRSSKITPISAHIQAAAGSPIAAEVTDWDGTDDTVIVKINGLSMVPLLNDGDVVRMKHKRASRSPFMKKGLIYLVEYDGGYTIKRYNTRPATPDEKGEEWVENGKVKVLESINRDFPEIVIKQQVEWVAWFDQSSNQGS